MLWARRSEEGGSTSADAEENSAEAPDPRSEKRMFGTMFRAGKSPERESPIHASTFQRITTMYDNIQLAKSLRNESEARRAAAAAAEEERRQQMAERVMGQRKLKESISQKRELLRQAKMKGKREQRLREAEWETQRVADQRKYERLARVNVKAAKELDARLDKAEAEQDRLERQEATAMKIKTRELLNRRQQEQIAANRAVVEALRTAKMTGRERAQQKLESKREAVEAEARTEQERMRRRREINSRKFFEKASNTKLEVVKVPRASLAPPCARRRASRAALPASVPCPARLLFQRATLRLPPGPPTSVASLVYP